MKVLVADDEPISRKMLEACLRRWGYDVIVAADGCEALRILHAPEAPKMAVLDWLMPGYDGVEICRNLRQREAEPYTYILLLTGKNTKQDVVQGLDAGADDYVVKPFDPDELQVRLRTGKRILYLQEQLIAAREAIREQSRHDSLTGLLNRAAVLEILSREIERQKRHGGSLGVALVDLDEFKQINDAHGHLVGDAVLNTVAQIMRNAVRPYDAVGRLGGEEFLVILPGCDKTNAASHAERLRAAIGRVSVDTPAGQPVPTAASIGVTVAAQEFSGDAYDLIRAADDALYRAKKQGRNRVEIADPAEQPALATV